MHRRVWALLFSVLLSGDVAFAAAASQRWDLNDVSYLYPLPASLPTQHRLLMRPDQSGRFGQLLPAQIVEGFHKLVEGPQTYADLYAKTRVVGVRIDPCFKMSEARACVPQLRFIWQPLVELPQSIPSESTGEVVADDAAMHTFYNLTNAEFASLMADLQALKAQNLKRTAPIQTTGRPLGVHPALADPRIRMEFSAHLNEIFLKYAGYARLTRVTQMRLSERNRHWHFSGIDRISGVKSVSESWRMIRIPRAASNNPTAQDLFHDGAAIPPPSQKGFSGLLQGENLGMWTAFPLGNGNSGQDLTDVMLSLFTNPGITSDDKKVLSDRLEFIDAIEDPARHDTTTMDCVHCHVAQPVKQWVKSQVPTLADSVPFVARGDREVLSKMFNLKNVSPALENTKNFRSFGYFGSVPSVNDRTILESANVARTLNSL